MVACNRACFGNGQNCNRALRIAEIGMYPTGIQMSFRLTADRRTLRLVSADQVAAPLSVTRPISCPMSTAATDPARGARISAQTGGRRTAPRTRICAHGRCGSLGDRPHGHRNCQATPDPHPPRRQGALFVSGDEGTRPLKPREAPVDHLRNDLRPGLAGKRRLKPAFACATSRTRSASFSAPRAVRDFVERAGLRAMGIS